MVATTSNGDDLRWRLGVGGNWQQSEREQQRGGGSDLARSPRLRGERISFGEAWNVEGVAVVSTTCPGSPPSCFDARGRRRQGWIGLGQASWAGGGLVGLLS